MAVKLRLKRQGRKKRPFYRIVAADSRSPRDGRYIEEIGYYNPLTDPSIVEVKEDRALYWLSQGAIPSDTVKNLLRDQGITLRFDLQKRGVSEEKLEEEMKKWEALQSTKLQRVAAKKASEAKAKEAKKAEAEKEKEAQAAAEAAEETTEAVEEQAETAAAEEAEAPAAEKAESAPEQSEAAEAEAPKETAEVPEEEAETAEETSEEESEKK